MDVPKLKIRLDIKWKIIKAVLTSIFVVILLSSKSTFNKLHQPCHYAVKWFYDLFSWYFGVWNELCHWFLSVVEQRHKVQEKKAAPGCFSRRELDFWGNDSSRQTLLWCSCPRQMLHIRQDLAQGWTMWDVFRPGPPKHIGINTDLETRRDGDQNRAACMWFDWQADRPSLKKKKKTPSATYATFIKFKCALKKGFRVCSVMVLTLLTSWNVLLFCSFHLSCNTFEVLKHVRIMNSTSTVTSTHSHVHNVGTQSAVSHPPDLFSFLSVLSQPGGARRGGGGFDFTDEPLSAFVCCCLFCCPFVWCRAHEHCVLIIHRCSAFLWFQ